MEQLNEAARKHVISILLANEAGVLSRVSGLFSARGYNIESLTVAETDDPGLSRMTIVTFGGDVLAKQIVSQLHKLVDVVGVLDIGHDRHIEREMLLLKIACDVGREDAVRIGGFVRKYGADVVENDDSICVVEMMARGPEIDEFIAAVGREWKIREVARSGVISLGRGQLILEV